MDHTWVHVTPESADSALINTIKQDPDYQSGRARVLVFARESAGADRVGANGRSKKVIVCCVQFLCILRRHEVQHIGATDKPVGHGGTCNLVPKPCWSLKND